MLTALYDANVLYPAPLRDFLMYLAVVAPFQALWSDDIHDEWTRNLVKNRSDLSSQKLERTRALMNVHVPNSLVTDYQSLIPALELPDADDRHVLAAAIKGDADIIVTFNLRDFPARTLENYQIRAQHPDNFIVSLLELDAPSVHEAVRRQRAGLQNPPHSATQLLDTLEAQGLGQSVALLRAFAAEF